MKNIFFLATLIIALFYSCTPKTNNEVKTFNIDTIPTKLAVRKKIDTTLFVKAGGIVVANKIVYDVVIKNPDKSDDWTAECLKNVDCQSLYGAVLKAVLDGKINAYSFPDEKLLSVAQVKELMNDKTFSKSNLAKLQFEEEWYFDDKNLRFAKQVNAIQVGFELFDDAGNVRGYKAAFKIKLNQKDAEAKK